MDRLRGGETFRDALSDGCAAIHERACGIDSSDIRPVRSVHGHAAILRKIHSGESGAVLNPFLSAPHRRRFYVTAVRDPIFAGRITAPES